MENDIIGTNAISIVLDDRGYRSVIKYDRKVPQFFDFGKLSKHENSATYAILGELRDRYNPNGIVFSYKDIAYMSGHVQEYPDGSVYARTGTRFNEFIENLQKKLQGVSYRKFISIKNGKEIYNVYPLFHEFQVNHASQELTVHLSDRLIQEEVIDEEGNIIQPELRVKDLFNNADWSTTQYLKFSRQLHNNLSVPAQNLYRFLSEYRSWGKTSMNAEVFENRIMHFVTAKDKKNKNSILKKAVKELQDLTYDGENQIFPNLDYRVERYRNKAVNYHFTFQPFSIDLNYMDSQKVDNVTLESDKVAENIIKESDLIDLEVLNRFHEVFSRQPNHDNGHNRKQLQRYIDSMSKEVVLEGLNRTAMDGRRGIGWFLKLLKNWEKEGVKSLDEIEQAESNIFNKPSKTEESNTNIPKWSDRHPDKHNTESKYKVLSDKAKSLIKQQQELLFRQMKALDEEELNNIHAQQESLQEELNQLIEKGNYYDR